MRTSAAAPSWLLAAAVLLPFLFLSAPLLEVDDARYAEVPRAMAASGDWILPTLNGMPYVEKPPLWYWLAGASIKVFGASEAAARLPLALLAALGIAGTWWLGSWLLGPGVGRVGALATATSALWLFLAHNMTLDLPVSVFLLWTTALALRALERPEDARWAAPLAWVAAALAFLSKGLIGLLLPGLWVAGLALLFPSRRRPALALLSPLGIAAFALIALPWYAAMQSRRPDFLRTFFLEQHFQRFLTPRYTRGAPWWFYLAVLPAALLPWTVPALAGLAAAVRRPWAEPRAAALAAWTLGVAAFFSVSHSKLVTYCLPALPHAALLAAWALERGLPPWAARAVRTLGGALILCAAIAYGILGEIPPPRAASGVDPALLRRVAALSALAVAALGAGQLFWRRRGGLPLGLGGAAAGALALAALGAAGPLAGVKDAALAVKTAAAPEDQVWSYGSYPHGVQFYTGRPVAKLVYFVGEFHYAKREPAFASRFGDDDAIRSLPRAGGKTFVLLRSFEREHFATLPARGSIVKWTTFGPWTLAEISAKPAR